jgi:hypothetical protein
MSEEGDRGFIDWTPNARSGELPDQILSVVHSYRGYPAPTVRDVYYRLLGAYGNTFGYDKDDPNFKRKVYRLLRQMRRVWSGPYSVDFDEINDDSATMLGGGGYTGPAGFWRTMKVRAANYRKSLTMNQPKRVIVFTEGAGEVRQFATVTREYGIPVYSGGGWDSLNLKYETGRDVAEDYRRYQRQTLILHAGDFDPDGVWLYHVFVADALAFAVDLGAPADAIVTRRVMTHPEQVPEHGRKRIERGLIKDMNHRGQQWPHHFKAEMQSMELPDRLRVMREALEEEVDRAQLEEDGRKSTEEREQIRRDFERLSGGEGPS